MIIKKEHEEKVKQLFSFSQAGENEKTIIRELATEYIGPAQVAVTCWTCPASIQNLYKMLTTSLTGYEVEQEKKENNETNKSSGPGSTEVNKKQNKKRPNTGTSSTTV